MIRWCIALIVSAWVLTGCAPATEQASGGAQTSTIKVVTSFTLITDMVQAIGGDLVEVHNLVPTGTDPHEYEPLPADITATADAEVLFFNGLNLEGGEDGWLSRLIATTELPADRIIEVAREVEPLYLGGNDGAAHMNPHAFIDPGVGVVMASAIRDGLSAADPANAVTYENQATLYIDMIEAIRAQYAEQLGALPMKSRVLVTSERAFQYLAKSYDFEEMFLWEIDTDENGSAPQLMRLIEQLRDRPVAHLFVESNVDRRPMEMVSEETGIPIFERPIYSDEIGDKDDPEVNTYLKYLDYNLRVLTEALE